MERCPDHSGIEQKFETIISEVRSNREAFNLMASEIAKSVAALKNQHDEDVRVLHERINRKEEERDDERVALETRLESLEKALVALKGDITKVMMRVLVWVLVTLGLPIGTWFVTRSVELIMAAGAGR